MTAALPIKTPAQPVTHPGSPRVDISAAVGRSGAGHPYPIWLNSDAKALLARVVAEKPERTKRITENFDGTVAEYGYRGKAASALRAIWNDWFMETSRWVDAAGVGTDLYHKRRNALIAYAEKHSADAVVARELDEQGHGYARKAVAK